jgi:hypothetical protein
MKTNRIFTEEHELNEKNAAIRRQVPANKKFRLFFELSGKRQGVSPNKG